MSGLISKLLMWLVYGALIGIPAGIISAVVVLPLSVAAMAFAPLAVLGVAVGFIVLGWWARFIVKKVHILGG